MAGTRGAWATTWRIARGGTCLTNGLVDGRVNGLVNGLVNGRATRLVFGPAALRVTTVGVFNGATWRGELAGLEVALRRFRNFRVCLCHQPATADSRGFGSSALVDGNAIEVSTTAINATRPVVHLFPVVLLQLVRVAGMPWLPGRTWLDRVARNRRSSP